MHDEDCRAIMPLVFSVFLEMDVTYIKLLAGELAGFGRLMAPAMRVIKTIGAIVNFMVSSASRSVYLSQQLVQQDTTSTIEDVSSEILPFPELLFGRSR